MKTRGNEDGELAAVMIHGRGATPESVLNLSQHIEKNIYYVAPEAKGREWYPESFLNPIEDNQPYLDRALEKLGNTVEFLEERGYTKDEIILLGFSQGGCLVTEYAARNTENYHAVIGLSGGLIGPMGKNFDYSGNMEETPVFLGCSENDPHIPKERVDETAEVFRELNADVEKRIYPGSAHSINQNELEWINENI